MNARSPMRMLGAALLVAAVAQGSARAEDSPATVTFKSLLEQMVDRDRLARLPDPPYLCKQFSSYDRRAKTPDDPRSWFANTDRGNVLGTETNAGRKEWVLMDHTGPGCIARIWAPDRRLQRGREDATARFYLDGAAEPAIEVHWLDLLTGRAFAKSPFAYVSRRAGVLYLPISYAKSCKITLDRVPFYFIINYRAYAAGTKVQTFSMDVFKDATETLGAAGKTLLAPPDYSAGKTLTIDKKIAPKGSESLDLPAGAAAVRQLRVTIDPREAQALRSTVLRMSFDGEQTLWCPMGDFFGSGVGYNPFRGWYRTVAKDGTMTCRWVMPYEKAGRLTVANLGAKPVSVKLSVTVGPWTWDKRSMRFHGNWRQQYPLPTRPMKDWNYIEATGRGVYVGDTLAIMNPVAKWWGEGDEKIWVDGESFPSHFGTGTEDYYGYAWGGHSNDFYEKPFHAQPQCGPGTFGQNTQTRTRALDAIPFTKSLKLDMEVWHWADCKAAYAVATYWYGRPGAKSNRGAEPDEAAREIPAPAPKPKPVKIPGAVELEGLKPSAKADGVVVQRQAYAKYAWSGGAQWLIRAKKVGDFVEFAVPCKKAGRRKIVFHGTKAVDYGQFRISINGKAIDRKFDFYNEQVVKTGPIELGVFEPKEGKFILRFEVIGSNARATGAKTYAGLDCVVLAAP